MKQKSFVLDALERKLIPVPLRYTVARARYLRARPPLRQVADPRSNEIAEIVRRDGIHIWPGYIPRDQALEIGAAARPMLEAVRDGTWRGEQKTLRDSEVGIYRILDADPLLPPAARVAIDDPDLLDIARLVTAARAQPHMRMVELRDGLRDACSEDCWHFDEPFKFKFKFFLYLTDVTEDTAPFGYVRRSHIPGKWRRAKQYSAYHFGQKGDWGFYHQHEFDAVFNRYGKGLGWEKMKCTAPAGTLILFDANGLHRRELLRQGSRVIMSNYYQAP